MERNGLGLVIFVFVLVL